MAKALSLALVLAAAALISIAAGATRAKTLHFKVTSASASATLTFQSVDKGNDSTTDGTIALKATSKSAAKGSIPGAIRAPLKGTIREEVVTKNQVSSTSPYQDTCSNVRKVAGKGGVILKRIGSRIQVRWAFPQAKPSFCTGPAVGSNITSRMKRVYSARALSGKHVTIVLSGSAKVPGETSSLTYRWHAVVKLSRA